MRECVRPIWHLTYLARVAVMSITVLEAVLGSRWLSCLLSPYPAARLSLPHSNAPYLGGWVGSRLPSCSHDGRPSSLRGPTVHVCPVGGEGGRLGAWLLPHASPLSAPCGGAVRCLLAPRAAPPSSRRRPPSRAAAPGVRSKGGCPPPPRPAGCSPRRAPSRAALLGVAARARPFLPAPLPPPAQLSGWLGVASPALAVEGIAVVRSPTRCRVMGTTPRPTLRLEGAPARAARRRPPSRGGDVSAAPPRAPSLPACVAWAHAVARGRVSRARVRGARAAAWGWSWEGHISPATAGDAPPRRVACGRPHASISRLAS